MPAGDASLKTAQLIKMLVDSNDGIYRNRRFLLRCMSLFLALRYIPGVTPFRSRSEQSGHGWTCSCFDPVANDPGCVKTPVFM
jgi:hypothetical protein